MGKYSAERDLNLRPLARWYVFANRTIAEVYKDGREEKFRFITRLENPAARLLERELDADKPGRGFASVKGGSIRHALDRRHHRHEQLAKKFAARVAKVLTKGLREEHYYDLVLVAEPHFLGLLRQEIPKNVQNRIKYEIRREYRKKNGTDLCKFVSAAIKKL